MWQTREIAKFGCRGLFFVFLLFLFLFCWWQKVCCLGRGLFCLSFIVIGFFFFFFVPVLGTKPRGSHMLSMLGLNSELHTPSPHIPHETAGGNVKEYSHMEIGM